MDVVSFYSPFVWWFYLLFSFIFMYIHVFTLYTKMESLIKTASAMGNSAGVYVPRQWRGKKVVVSLFSPKEQILDALRPHMHNIVGVYLYGSYARGEQRGDSDVDVLVVVSRKIKVDYRDPLNMMITPKDDLELVLREDPIQLWPIISECIPIVNEAYLQELKKTEIKAQKYLDFILETKKKLGAYRQMIQDERHLGAVIYSLVLRLRSIYLINLLMRGGRYSNAGFQEYMTEAGIERESAENVCRIYRNVRDNKPLPEKIITLNEILQLLEVVEKENSDLKMRIKNAKPA